MFRPGLRRRTGCPSSHGSGRPDSTGYMPFGGEAFSTFCGLNISTARQ
ncbi:hypothetical protein [Streptomyces sp. col6]|nr:hypothetical protein [Streptomyces sp. col6]